MDDLDEKVSFSHQNNHNNSSLLTQGSIPHQGIEPKSMGNHSNSKSSHVRISEPDTDFREEMKMNMKGVVSRPGALNSLNSEKRKST